MRNFAVAVWFLASVCTCAKLPPGFKKCDREQRDFDECVAKAAEYAIRQLDRPLKRFGLPSLEPLEIRDISVGPGRGAVAFEQNFTYLHVFELTNVQVRRFEFDFEANAVLMECFFPEVRYEFEFSFNGTVVAVPIFGRGLGRVVMEKVTYTLNFELEEYVKNGKKFYRVADGKLVMATENLRANLKNLFDGDKVLEAQINKVINDNWELVLDQAKGSYEVILGKYFSAIFDNLLSKVPISELFGRS